eukprot:364183-Chlamydomonas_euryale.AAC.9
MVLREVRAVYKIVCEGIMNLADKFFEMGRNDATRALDIYKENVVRGRASWCTRAGWYVWHACT